MGLFGGKTKVTVATTVSRVIEDKDIPDSVTSATYSSLFNAGNRNDYLMENLISSIGVRANRYYNYGKDSYENGVPSGQYLKANSCKTAVENILSSIEGAPMTTTYCFYGPPNITHIGWVKAIELYGLNTETNELTTLSAQIGRPVYMRDLQVVIPESMVDSLSPSSLEQWGIPPNTGYCPSRNTGSLNAGTVSKYSAITTDATASDDYFILTYEYEIIYPTTDPIAPRILHTEVAIFNNNFYLDNEAYFQARYLKNGVPKYFMYQDGLGTYPSLDEIFTTENTPAGNFFPITYFRYNGASISADKNTNEYKTSKKLVKKLGLDYDDMATNIDANPNIAQVQQGMLMFAVPAVTSNEKEIQYLFDFFKSMYEMVTTSTANSSQSLDRAETLLKAGKSNGEDFDSASTTNASSLVIQDKKFKMTLNHGGIYRNFVIGSIGPAGKVTTNFYNSSNSQVFRDFMGNSTVKTLPATLHVYRKQLTANVYEEYQVANLQMTYHIYGNYAITADETDDILLIPIDHSIVKKYSVVVREELLSRALHFVFNSAVITHIKWYQTGIFRVFLIVLAIAITYYSGGTAWESIGAALAAGAVGTAVMLILEMVFWRILFAYVFKLFVRLVGIKIAFILAVVAAISGTYLGVENGGLEGAPYATELLQASTNLIEASNVVLKEQIGDFLAEVSAFDKQMKEEMKLLEDAERMLEPTARLNPLIIFGESPDDFYNRTIHTGNIGTLSITAVSEFVNVKLRLPDLTSIDQFQGD